MGRTAQITAFTLCLIAFVAHAAFAIHSREFKASWANVPPAPTEQGATMIALGDAQFALRMYGLMIQNLGDTGGRSTAFPEYDYDTLGQWFMLSDTLDRRSDYFPLLAAYYFSATPVNEDLDPLIDYLAMVGQRTYGEKWRWLAQAVYLARFRQNNLEKAMGLAHIMANMDHPDMPTWTRQMPAFIAAQQGDKEAALAVIMSILRDEAEDLHPNEVNFMVHYICERLLDETEAAQHPLCNAPK